jgi:hypothetical protein
MFSTRLLGHVVLFLALAGATSAQSIFLDFEDPASPFGIPSPTYGAGGPAGMWQSVSNASTQNLVDINGVVTPVTLTAGSPPMLEACAHPGTTGGDEALYDDRWFFDPPSVTLTLSGLEAGIYVVHLHLLVASCTPMFSPMSVTIDGASPRTDFVLGTGWTGVPEHGRTYSTQIKHLAAGEDLVLLTSTPQGFCCYTQHCGLQILRYDPPQTFCSGDGSAAPCPCGNSGFPGHGCDNSLATGGARLRVTSGSLSSVSADTIELNASGLPATAPLLYFQGTSQLSGGFGAAFGDGLRCAGGSAVRLATKIASGGASSFPAAGDPPVSVRGMVPPGGGTRTYQVWYRNAAAFCTPSSFNLSNGVQLVWGP